MFETVVITAASVDEMEAKYNQLQEQADASGDTYVVRQRFRVGKNAPCVCGSGKKYKKCCRGLDETEVVIRPVGGEIPREGSRGQVDLASGEIPLEGVDSMSEEDLRDQLDAYRGDIYRLRGELEEAQAEAAALWGELEGTQRWLAKVGADEGYPTAVTVAKEIARKLDDAKRAHTFLDRLRKAEELAEKTERERDEARRRHDFYMECLETVLGPVRERRATGEPAESDRTAVKRIIYQRDNLQARVKELETEVDRLKHLPSDDYAMKAEAENRSTLQERFKRALKRAEESPEYWVERVCIEIGERYATKAEMGMLAEAVYRLVESLRVGVSLADAGADYAAKCDRLCQMALHHLPKHNDPPTRDDVATPASGEADFYYIRRKRDDVPPDAGQMPIPKADPGSVKRLLDAAQRDSDDVPPVEEKEGESSRDLPEDPFDLVGAPHGGGPGG